MPGLTLDAGALVAFERNERRIVALLLRNIQHGHRLAVPGGVVGQMWRDWRRQARLARLLGAAHTEVIALDDQRAREAGQLCGVRGTTDVIAASVVLCARTRGDRIVTSDPDDIRRLDPSIPLITV